MRKLYIQATHKISPHKNKKVIKNVIFNLRVCKSNTQISIQKEISVNMFLKHFLNFLNILQELYLKQKPLNNCLLLLEYFESYMVFEHRTGKSTTEKIKMNKSLVEKNCIVRKMIDQHSFYHYFDLAHHAQNRQLTKQMHKKHNTRFVIGRN